MAEDDEKTAGIEPHDTRVVVWAVPATIECSETFSIKVGVKCADECRTDGWTLEVRDHEGERQAIATTHDEPWADTTELHYAEVTLTAPATEGLHTWEASAPVNALDIPHTDGITRFGVRTVLKPEHCITVVAVDAKTQTPVEGAKVALHPYRTLTDEHGVAEVRVPQGEYRLFVSGKKYIPFRHDCAINADVTIQASLVEDRELSDADIWI